MKKLLVIAIVSCSIFLSGCTQLGSWIPKVLPLVTDIISEVIDAEKKLDKIEQAAVIFFQQNPDKEAEKDVRAAIATARASLEATLAASRATKDFTQQNYDGAFDNFMKLWKELEVLLKVTGIVKEQGMLAAGPNTGLVLEEPLAIKRRK